MKLSRHKYFMINDAIVRAAASSETGHDHDDFGQSSSSIPLLFFSKFSHGCERVSMSGGLAVSLRIKFRGGWSQEEAIETN